ncbi:MAG: hypothetical protein AAFV53_28010 [Myxococcota bacterium]
MSIDDTALSLGWFAPQSVALLLLATAQAGARPIRMDFISGLLTEHLRDVPLPPKALIVSTLEYIDALLDAGGLRRVFTALHEHCQRLQQILDVDSCRKIVRDMICVVEAMNLPHSAEQLYAFPYAAARVWRLDDLAEHLLRRRP